jgi:RNA polymerase sigma-70 factor, ECF subfamily
MLDRQDGAAGLAPLIAATARGDRTAFAALYAATSTKLFGTALAVLKRRDLAEDVVQEAYVRIWQHAERYDPARGSPITWMATIVRHLAIDMIRGHNGRTTGGEAELMAIPADAPDAFDQMAARERERRALAILNDLDPMKRRLVIAAYLQGESREQLAARFGAPVNTVKTWLRRAILEMRAAAEHEGSGRRVA